MKCIRICNLKNMTEIPSKNHVDSKLIKQGKLKIVETPYSIYKVGGAVYCETPHSKFLIASTYSEYLEMSTTFVEYLIYEGDRYEEKAMFELYGPSGGR